MSYPSASRMAACALACAVIVTLVPVLAAQAVAAPPQPQPDETLASPLQPLGLDAATGLPLFAPRGDAITALAVLAARADHPRLLLQDVALGGGRSVALDLASLDLGRLRFGFQVDGRPAGDLLDGLDLSVWTGAVAGAPGSEALLAVSTRGVWGWVRTDATGEAVHLLSRPTDGDWTRATVVLGSDSELAARGLRPGPLCAGELAAPLPSSGGQHAPGGGPTQPVDPGDGAGDCSHWECGMAIATDFQLFSLFNDLGAEASYISALLAAISARYEEQIDTLLVFPYVAFYTTASDPWTTPDLPGSSVDMLTEFQAAWAGAVPAGANLGHFLSGADLGGGVAWLDVLSDTSHTFTFGVSGNVDGTTPFPIAVGPLNWDFMVCAHETGHNFGSPHTHDFVPPIDECAFGICITDGTIMSYCHLCPGGMNNITTYFHPLCVDLMKAGANAGLPLEAPLVAPALTQPTLIEGYVSTPVMVDVQGSPVGPVMLNWRSTPTGAFHSKTMVPFAGTVYTANLPGPACGDEPEWYFSMDDASCGPFNTASFTASVGHQVTLLTDHIEVDSGWTAGILSDDATSGFWERGDPLGTGPQPDEDLSVPGTDCFFTGQGTPGGSAGENDVDGGRTTLVTPPIDLSAGDARISYWRWYSNDAGAAPNTDIFEVEISNDGANWVNVETVGPAGEGTGGLWFRHELQVSDFVAPNATVQLRFIASDMNDGSIIEAAVDELEVFRLECGAICQADLGFAGPGTSTLSVCGGDLTTGTTATLSITGATPGGVALLVAGLDLNPSPVQGGTFVPMPPTLRYFVAFDETGAYSYTFPGGGGPLSLYVQAVYPQASLPAPGWGFTNAVRVDLQP